MPINLPQLLSERTARYGTKEVFRYKNQKNQLYESLNWKQLKTSTDKVANSLLYLGCEKGSKVGIFSSNKPEWTITDLGILTMGGIVVPMYSTASRNDVKYIIDETEINILFVGSKEQLDKAKWLLNECGSLKKVIIYESGLINTEDDRILQWNNFLELSNDSSLDELNQIIKTIKEEDLATIIYTSGTTGIPKGAMLTHKNFLKALEINYERLNINDTDISLCFLPLSHVFERTWSYFLIYCGAINIFLEDPKKVIDEMQVVKPTTMCTVPRFYEKTFEGILKEKAKWPKLKQKIFDWSISIGHKIIEYKKNSEEPPLPIKIKNKIADKLVLSKLRYIFGGKIKVLPFAGAAIEAKLLKFFHATGLFINYGYGATETTATVSCFRTDKYDFDYCGSIMPDIEVKIGENKEILVKGDTIFKGYFKKPQETDKVLQNGWYYSGDEGEIIENEYLNMTDRIKDLIKTSGGKYVSPQKIELLLSQDEYIDQIVVIGDKRKYITAIIIPSLDKLDILAQLLKLKEDNVESLIKNKAIKEFFQERIDDLQKDLTPFEKVVKFTLISDKFSIDNSTLTNTLKIKRKEVNKKYFDLIDKMYLSA